MLRQPASQDWMRSAKLRERSMTFFESLVDPIGKPSYSVSFQLHQLIIPRVVYRFGEQSHAVKEFLRTRRFIKCLASSLSQLHPRTSKS